MRLTLAQYTTQELANETPVNQAKTPILGYGVDLSCTTDLTFNFAETDPMSQNGLTESILRRLSTTSGALALIDDSPNYGLDIVGLLSTGTRIQDLRAMEGQIQTELRKDDRIAGLNVEVSYVLATESLDIRIQVVPVDPGVGGFDLVFAVDSQGILQRKVK